jgi:2-amino-4-hydroxy-6-hydroxymethyldihydropteridine diphosphokinase
MADQVRQAFIGVGANLGDRWGTIRAALTALAREPGVVTVEESAVYETAPVGLTDQPSFLNLVAGVETTLTPGRLLSGLHSLEKAAGRRREREVRWGPRPLDLDLLLFEGEKRAGPELILPHPRMWERAFVLVPLRELLARVRWFDRPEWAAERTRLAAATTVAGGVVRWHPDGRAGYP